MQVVRKEIKGLITSSVKNLVSESMIPIKDVIDTVNKMASVKYLNVLRCLFSLVFKSENKD
jgi:hypothetical protein